MDCSTWCCLSSFRSKHIINSSLNGYLQILYAKLSTSSVEVPSAGWKYSSVNMKSKQLGCSKSPSSSSSIVLALWKTDLFGQPSLLDVDDVEQHLVNQSEILRAARINSIILHRATIEEKTHLLVSLSWFKFHRVMFKLGKPLTVWCPDLFEAEGIHSTVPIQFIKNRTVSIVS